MLPAGSRYSVIGPGTRWLLYAVYACVALLTATAVYLGGVTAAEWARGASYQGYVYQWAVLAHLAVGLLVLAPFVAFAVAHPAGGPHPSQSPRRPRRLSAGGALGRRARDGPGAHARGGPRAAPAGRAHHRLLAARGRALRRRVGVPAASPPRPSAARRRRMGLGHGHRRRGARHRRGRRAPQPRARPGRCARHVRPVVRAHGHRPAHSRRRAHGRHLLRRVPRRRAPGLARRARTASARSTTPSTPPASRKRAR